MARQFPASAARGDLPRCWRLSLGVSALVLVQPFLTKLLIDDGLMARDFPKPCCRLRS